jgi:hypothetical protein
MSNIRDALIEIQKHFETAFHDTGILITDPAVESFNADGWYNLVWTSKYYHKACISVIDASSTKGVWMMHCCIFPHFHNSSPIFGFDVFAGKTKITGCFHDFSPVVSKHKLSKWFATQSKKLTWNKKRELPVWAKAIFSDDIIAAGNVQSDDEILQISTFVKLSLETYLDRLLEYNHSVDDISCMHRLYCDFQRMNPHNPVILKSLGLTEEQATRYIKDCLFPTN